MCQELLGAGDANVSLLLPLRENRNTYLLFSDRSFNQGCTRGCGILEETLELDFKEFKWTLVSTVGFQKP